MARQGPAQHRKPAVPAESSGGKAIPLGILPFPLRPEPERNSEDASWAKSQKLCSVSEHLALGWPWPHLAFTLSAFWVMGLLESQNPPLPPASLFSYLRTFHFLEMIKHSRVSNSQVLLLKEN